jgi:selenide,water dikinase
MGCIPGGETRNFNSYGSHIHFKNDSQRVIICDPQTSGGLLVAVAPGSVNEVKLILRDAKLESEPIGVMVDSSDYLVRVQ